MATAQKLMGLVVACAAVALPASLGRAAPRFQASELPLEALVREVQERYRGLEDLRARFVQRQTQRPGAPPIERSGRWLIRAPGRMRVEYEAPVRLWVADGTRLFHYLPEDNQVQVYAPEAVDPTQTPTLYLTGEGDLRADFYISGTQWDAPLAVGNIQVRLEPRAPESRFTHLILEIEPATLTIARLVSFGLLGDSSDYQFFEVETNVGLPDELFQFTIPADASVEYLGS